MSTKTTRASAVAAFLLLSTAAVQAAEGVTLTRLQSLEQFQQEFEKDDGVPRLVLLLSPT